MNKLLKKKPKEAFSQPIQNTFNLISYNIDNPTLMGSSSLSSIEYNNDYDLYEVVHKSTNVKKACKSVHNRFKKIINNLEKSDSKDIYFLDFKLGLDNDLIPTTSNIKAFYKLKYDDGLITKEQYNNIINSKENELDEAARQIYTLRWEPNEIKQGYKVLSNNRRENFCDALKDKAIIKLDIAYYVYNQFIEFSNIYEIHYNNVTYMPSVNIQQSLKDDLRQLLKDGNYFKYLKRVFVIARINKDERLIKNLIDLFNSNIGLLYKIASQLNTMIDILDKGYKPIDKIHQSLQFLKQQLGYIYDFNLPKDIFKQFDSLTRYYAVTKLREKLIKIREKLIKIVNQEAFKNSVF